MSHWSLQPRSENMARLTRSYLRALASPSTTVSPCSSILYSFQEFLLPLSWSMLVGVCAQSCPSLCDPWTVAHQAPLPCDFPGKNTGLGCHFLLQGIFLTQRLNLCLLGLLHCQAGFFFFFFFLPAEPPEEPFNEHMY